MCHNYVPTVTDSAEANTGNHSNYYEIISYIQLGEENLSHQFCIYCCKCKVLSCEMKMISVQVGKVGTINWPVYRCCGICGFTVGDHHAKRVPVESMDNITQAVVITQVMLQSYLSPTCLTCTRMSNSSIHQPTHIMMLLLGEKHEDQHKSLAFFTCNFHPHQLLLYDKRFPHQGCKREVNCDDVLRKREPLI